MPKRNQFFKSKLLLSILFYVTQKEASSYLHGEEEEEEEEEDDDEDDEYESRSWRRWSRSPPPAESVAHTRQSQTEPFFFLPHFFFYSIFKVLDSTQSETSLLSYVNRKPEGRGIFFFLCASLDLTIYLEHLTFAEKETSCSS